MSSTLRRSLASFALLAGLARCASDPSGLYVTVRINAPNVTHVHVQTYNGLTGAMPMDMPTTYALAGRPVPYTFVVMNTGRYSRVGIQAFGTSDRMAPMPESTGSFAYDRVIADYADDEMREVTLDLRPPCGLGVRVLDRICPLLQHCSTAVVPTCTSAQAPNPPRHRW